MSKFTLVGELPRHRYVWVDTEFTHEEPQGFEPAVWFGLVSFPGRVWGCTVMLKSGAVYRNLPPHAIAFKPGVKGHVHDSQMWDCYGEAFTVIEYTYLSGLRCRVHLNSAEAGGSYLFTAAPAGDGFSAYPEQAKEFAFIEMDDGTLTIQPTNRVLFEEKSFTDKPTFVWPDYLKRQTDIYHCE